MANSSKGDEIKEGEKHQSFLRRSLILITVAGCLAMVYLTAVTSPAATEYFRKLGATEFHFSLLAGLPMVMLSLQFVGAMLTNRLRRRKPTFMVLNILGRLMYLFIAFLPLLFKGVPKEIILFVIIALLAISSACNNIVTPLWLSWMGDVIPRRKLSTFWGQRHAWMHTTWTACYLIITIFTYYSGLPVDTAFRVLVVIGVVAGVVDILLFIWVDDPEPELPEGETIWTQLLEPLKDKNFRSFLIFNCAWNGAVMWAASFMQIYILKVLGLSVWQTTMIWCTCGVGSIIAARTIGRLADRHGNRPLLIISVSLKSMIVIVFLLISRKTVMWILPLAFLFDSMLNSLLVVATNGYIMKSAPRDNRAMFVAAVTGLAGICGGLGAMAGGAFLEALDGMTFYFIGHEWNNYQFLFFIGIFLRWGCIMMVRRIKEPESSHSAEVLEELDNIWPFQVFLFPLELGKRFLRLLREEEET